MKILGDSQILLFNELFSSLGEVSTYTGRHISPQQLEGVDALITRSTLKVDRQLLAGSSVKFVGSCIVGTDHLDIDYLDSESIVWTNAPGCNAEAVVQYVLSVMAQLKPQWQSQTIGIVGCGNIGGRVYRRLKALGMSCSVYDPFLSLDDVPDLVSLEQVLACDMVTCHVPLTTSGTHPSLHMLGQAELDQLRSDTLLISAGRGAVIDNQALKQKLQQDKQQHRATIKVALDVWEGEPDIDPELLELVDIATPHIAGHSLEGKEKGTVMVYESLCDFLKVEPPVDATTVVNAQRSTLDLPAPVQTPYDSQDDFNQLLLQVYPVSQDDQQLREWLQTPHDQTIAQHFDYMRKNYPVRREFTHYDFQGQAALSSITDWLHALTT